MSESVERFFIDHGMIHDRATGKHVSTEPIEYDEGKFDDTPVRETRELLNQLQSDIAALREGRFDDIVRAYEAGALDVHNNWQEDRDPDFTEAAHDYARNQDNGSDPDVQ